MPIFYSESVVLQDKQGELAYPFFFSKDDLDAAYRQYGGGSGAQDADDAAAFAAVPFGGGPSKPAQKAAAPPTAVGMPVEAVRVVQPVESACLLAAGCSAMQPRRLGSPHSAWPSTLQSGHRADRSLFLPASLTVLFRPPRW